MIKISIDLTKIDKSRIKEKNGKKFYDMIIMDSRNDKYGNDYMVVEDIPKADREAGKKGTILGNGKNLQSNSPNRESGREDLW